MEYRINVDNKFAAIQADDDNEADPVEVLLKLQEQLILSKKSANTSQKSASGANKKAGISTVASKNEKNSQKSNLGGKQTSTKTAVTANAISKSSPAKPAPNKFTEKPRFGENVQSTANDVRPSFDSWGGEPKPERDETSSRGRMGFRRGGGFGRGGRQNHEGTDRFGKREFDRHSGSDKSGFKPHEKREGGGAHNWGSVKDDIAEHLSNTGASDLTDANRSEPTEESASPDQPVVDGDAEVKKEEEERQLTLDEWKKLEEEKRVRSQFNIRKPNEGCSDPKWNKMYVLKKKDDDEEDEEEEEEEDDENAYDGKKPRNVVPIRITFNDARRGNRGGRGGRGGGAGGARRSEGDGEKKKATKEAPAPNVDDEKDFPSLS